MFGGGCFWCTEAVFKMLKGVTEIMPGYAGGLTKNPSYDDVCGGKTGHAEVIEVTYDPDVIKLDILLTVFFASHDGSLLNRQGNDVGTQYRSAVFFTTPEQQIIVENFIQELNASSNEGKPLVTEVAALDIFYPAESYHKDYFARNKGAPYCQVIINPKLEKVQKKFAELLRQEEE